MIDLARWKSQSKLAMKDLPKGLRKVREGKLCLGALDLTLVFLIVCGRHCVSGTKTDGRLLGCKT